MAKQSIKEIQDELRSNPDVLEKFKAAPKNFLSDRGIEIGDATADALSKEITNLSSQPQFDPAAITISVTIK